jgi:hypothetical protein
MEETDPFALLDADPVSVVTLSMQSASLEEPKTKLQLKEERHERFVLAAEVYMAGVYPDLYFQFEETAEESYSQQPQPPDLKSLVDVANEYAVSKSGLHR